MVRHILQLEYADIKYIGSLDNARIVETGIRLKTKHAGVYQALLRRGVMFGNSVSHRTDMVIATQMVMDRNSKKIRDANAKGVPVFLASEFIRYVENHFMNQASSVPPSSSRRSAIHPPMAKKKENDFPAGTRGKPRRQYFD